MSSVCRLPRLHRSSGKLGCADMAAIMVRDLPMDERPREKLLKYGSSYLSNAELLAILLRTGVKDVSVLRVAEEVLSHFEGKGISGLVHMVPQDLADIKGVGLTKAATILAAVELGRRLSVQAAESIDTIGSPEDAAHYAMPRYRHELQEHFALMTLDMKNHITGFFDLTTGTLSASLVHPREVYRKAIQQSAASIIVFHNHPSGDPSPSREDIAVTERLAKSGKVLGIELLDHIILGKENFLSMKEEGMVQ